MYKTYIAMSTPSRAGDSGSGAGGDENTAGVIESKEVRLSLLLNGVY